MSAYCRDVLGYSEDAAWSRAATANVVRGFPVVLGWLADGTLSLTAVRMLRPILTSANYLGVLTEARRRSKTEVEHHVQPFGHQGPATVDNISLRCRAHNVYESEQVFGRFDRADLNFYVASREYTPFRNGG